MKCFVVLLACAAIVAQCSEECKVRKNHVSYRVEGIDKVVGIPPFKVLKVLHSATKIWEETISEMWFHHTHFGIYQEEIDLVFNFMSFKEYFRTHRSSEWVAFTENNCTSEGWFAGEEIRTIHNSTINFNTDVVWKYNNRVKKTRKVGVSLFYVAIHEIGRALGLNDTNNADSIMFTNTGNFETFQFNNSKLPIVDLYAANQLYLLKDNLLPGSNKFYL